MASETILIKYLNHAVDCLDLVAYLNGERGIHSAETRANHENHDFGWLRITGTDLAVRKAKMMVKLTRVWAEPNSDHDHNKCIENAAKLGVPPAWAHTPETYLSS